MKRTLSLLSLLMTVCLLCSCDMRVKVDLGEGSAGQSCRDGGKCDKGLTCIAGVCLESELGLDDIIDDLDKRKSAGESCSRDTDCQSDLACLLYEGDYICTARCNADSVCPEIWAGSECLKNENGEFVCVGPENHGDETTDGDGNIETPDEDRPETDGDNDMEEADGDSLCVEGTTRCDSGDLLMRCNDKGLWVPESDCDHENKECIYDACVDPGDVVCESGQQRCTGSRILENCNIYGTEWVLLRNCDLNEACLEGECRNMEENNLCIDEEGCTDENKYCFIRNEEDSVGYCRVYCDMTYQPCPTGFECLHGICERIENYCLYQSMCHAGEYCDQDANLCKPYCYRDGVYCPQNYYCDLYEDSANYGRCIPKFDCTDCTSGLGCTYPDHCYIPSEAEVGCCQPGCLSDEDCVAGMICHDTNCVIVDSSDCGGQCPEGYVCDPAYNICVLNCPICPQGYSCNAESAPNCFEGCTPPPGGFCGFGQPDCCPHTYCAPIYFEGVPIMPAYFCVEGCRGDLDCYVGEKCIGGQCEIAEDGDETCQNLIVCGPDHPDACCPGYVCNVPEDAKRGVEGICVETAE